MTERQLLDVKLGNRGNSCYANSVLKALLFLSCAEGKCLRIFGESHIAFLQGLARKACASVVHLRMHPVWLGMMQGWRHPSRQHDTAEFLQFLCRAPLINHPCIELSWQARSQAGARHSSEVIDQGNSAPLLLPSPGDIDEDGTTVVTVQGLIDQWHMQEQKHAMFVPADAVIFQLCRFHFAAEGSRAVKRRYEVQPDPIAELPLFDTDLQCHSRPYRLNSYIGHLGNAPDHGHYHNVFCSTGDVPFYVGDDGTSARPIDATEVSSLNKDIYLLFYVAL